MQRWVSDISHADALAEAAKAVKRCKDDKITEENETCEFSGSVLLWDQLSDDIKKRIADSLQADPEDCLFVIDEDNKRFLAFTNVVPVSIDTTDSDGMHRRIDTKKEIDFEFKAYQPEVPGQMEEYLRHWIEAVQDPKDKIILPDNIQSNGYRAHTSFIDEGLFGMVEEASKRRKMPTECTPLVDLALGKKKVSDIISDTGDKPAMYSHKNKAIDTIGNMMYDTFHRH